MTNWYCDYWGYGLGYFGNCGKLDAAVVLPFAAAALCYAAVKQLLSKCCVVWTLHGVVHYI